MSCDNDSFESLDRLCRDILDNDSTLSRDGASREQVMADIISNSSDAGSIKGLTELLPSLMKAYAEDAYLKRPVNPSEAGSACTVEQLDGTFPDRTDTISNSSQGSGQPSAHETVDGSSSIPAEQTPSISIQKLLRSGRMVVLQQSEPSEYYKIPENAKGAVSALLDGVSIAKADTSDAPNLNFLPERKIINKDMEGMVKAASQFRRILEINHLKDVRSSVQEHTLGFLEKLEKLSKKRDPTVMEVLGMKTDILAAVNILQADCEASDGAGRKLTQLDVYDL